MPYFGGQAQQTTPQFLMERLMKGGLSREQAAALVGNLQKESSLITNNVNEGEQAYGLMQWRGDRFKNLQNFAVQNGRQWTDPGVQADFALHEMKTTEANNAQRFLQAKDIIGANDALHAVIRYKDPSEAAQRGQLAQQAFGQSQNVADPAQKQDQAMPAPPNVSRETLAYSAMPRDEFAIPSNARGMRGGIQAIGAALGQGIANKKLGGVFGVGQQPAQSVAGSPEALSGFKGLFGGGGALNQPGAQGYLDPNTGNQMATDLPGRYSQGDVLNLGRPPAAAGQAQQPVAPMPTPRPQVPLANPNQNVAGLRDQMPDELMTHEGDFGALV